MESNTAHAGSLGGAVLIGHNCTLTIQRSRFLKNVGVGWGTTLSLLSLNLIIVQDSTFDSNYISDATSGTLGFGGAVYSLSDTSSISIIILNTTFSNCSAAQGGALYIFAEGNALVEVKNSRFVDNFVLSNDYITFGGAVYLSFAPDTQINPGCIIEQETSRERRSVDSYEFPSWAYKSNITFENSVFVRNAGAVGGALYTLNGYESFRNCSFIDNVATFQGGHIYTGEGSSSIDIQNCIFRQKVLRQLPNQGTKATFIHSKSSGALKLYNTTMDSHPYETDFLLLVRNGRLIDLGNNNLTIFNCPNGSQINIINYTDQVTLRVNKKPCKIKVTTLEVCCSTCEGNFYSLQRGRAVGSHVVPIVIPGFQCLPCPFGANCSQNIIAKPNFWGFQEQRTPPKLKFTMCPLGYCRPPDIRDFPKYNGCQGNRSGELCGQCSDGYSETLFSTNCRPSQECNDNWFWPVALLYVLVMAFYFTFKPPIVPWMKRQVLWFKTRDTTDEENEFHRGYLKIIFYFYQAANLLLVSSTSLRIFRTMFAEILVGIFNFQLRVSSGGLICPVPGITVVTKQLFSVSHVFGTCLMIGIIYVVHWGVQKFRGREVPFAGPYIGGILQTMLLGYTTLASVSFDLLRCVPIGSEKRMFYDGNVECFQWWQYMLIVFVCAFFVPFVLVLFWGSFKLYNQTLSGEKLVLACFIPLPSLVYWAFISLIERRKYGDNKETLVSTNAGNDDTPSINITVNSIKTVLYDSFKRPEVGGKLSLGWESVMIGRRLILVVLKALVSDPMSRLLVMIFFCVFFFHHHSMIQPFRDSLANRVETISLLFLTVLAILNMFFASFLSLAATSDADLSSWWDGGQVLQVIILCAVPTLFCLLVVAAVLSQLSRLIIVAGRFLRKFMWICLSMCDGDQNDERRPLRLVT